ncbi:MATE family efflux transporter, partial [Clostridioides difficile]|nr:MATE family efflux transporter [Clostridioides difficile]
MDAIRPEENKMGTMPVNKLLLTMSLPMVISMLIQALYNVVDSIFVAQISETALTAVSLAFPIQNLIIAIAVGTGVGVNALLSRSLGEKNPEKANLAAVNGIFIFILSYLVSALFGIFFSRFYFTVQTGNEEIINQGTIYLSICTIFSFGVYLQIAFERIM